MVARFKAVNTRDKNDAHGAIQRRMAQVEASIVCYFSALEAADRQQALGSNTAPLPWVIRNWREPL
jgi:hypothetical protein